MVDSKEEAIIKLKITKQQRIDVKTRNWFLTINNPTIIFEELYKPSKMRFLAGQLELGDKEKTEHY